MSSKNIILEGATYNGVESITLPTSGGGSATFNEVSDTTAIAEDVASGKFFYNASGVLTEGTASGGGGGGLEYEFGTYTPTESVSTQTKDFLFENSHSTRPIFVAIYDAKDTTKPTNNSFAFWRIINNYDAFGTAIYYASSVLQYGSLAYGSFTSSGISVGTKVVNALSGSDYMAMDYNISNTGFSPRTGTQVKYYRPSRVYKWIAVWKPQ